jgi:hypothetical protein
LAFADNLAGLSDADHLGRIELGGPDGTVAMMENVPGSQGSLRVYQYLAGKYGVIGPDGAKEGLRLDAEHTAEGPSQAGQAPQHRPSHCHPGRGASFDPRACRTPVKKARRNGPQK